MKKKLKGKAEKVLSDAILGYTYKEEVSTYDRKKGKWITTTVKRYKAPDPIAAAKWLSLNK